MGDAAPGTSPEIRSVPLGLLDPGPFQPRAPVDQADLGDLILSIKSQGILQPLLARPHPQGAGRLQIIAGERRWRAAQAAGLPEVPVLVRDLRDGEAMAAALVENLQRQDLNAIEEAEGFRRLVQEFSMTQENLGAAVGKSRSHVANTMRLLSLPSTVQNEVRNGSLSAGHARALLAHPEPAKAALQVIARGLNVRQTEALATSAAGVTGPSPGKPARERDPETQAVEQELSERLGLRVNVSFDVLQARSASPSARAAAAREPTGHCSRAATKSGTRLKKIGGRIEAATARLPLPDSMAMAPRCSRNTCKSTARISVTGAAPSASAISTALSTPPTSPRVAANSASSTDNVALSPIAVAAVSASTRAPGPANSASFSSS
jgi:ParB family chromosome partitioning protein